jgi:hypothetical protein
MVPAMAIIAVTALFWVLNPLSFAQAQATPLTRYASPNGAGSAPCTTPANPCTLQTAVTAAQDGDDVLVAAGVYNGNPVLLLNKSITVTGGYLTPTYAISDPTINLTFLDGGGVNRVVDIAGVVTPTISGFIIQNGAASSGAGIRNLAGNPIIRGNIIHDNIATAEGGGIFDGGAARIEENEIYNNDGGQGGGIYVQFGGANSIILFNDIHDNSATLGAGSGGGIYINSGSFAFIEGNEIYDNLGPTGGGIGIEGAIHAQNNFFYRNHGNTSGGGVNNFGTAVLWNNTFAGNSTTAGGQGGAIFNGGGAIVVISNTIVASNTAGSGAGIYNFTGGTVTGDYNNIFNNNNSGAIAFTNVITADPEFASFGSNINLHLRETSPNIDAGDPATSTDPNQFPSVYQDIDGQTRPNPDGANRVDIGADEQYPDVPDFSLAPAIIVGTYGNRGEVVTYSHLLENQGTISDTYTFLCSNSRGWSVTCPGSTTLDVGQQTGLETYVAVPLVETALAQATTLITATSTISPALQRTAVIQTIVFPYPGVSFTPNYTNSLLPGETMTFTHRITNTGDAIDTFTIDIVQDIGGWSVVVPYDPLTITLGPGGSTNVQMAITVPPFAAAQVENESHMRAVSSYTPVISATVVNTITARATVGARFVNELAGNATDFNNNCTQRNYPCLTLEHAIAQAAIFDEVRVAGGTYVPASGAISINDTIFISGGWNSSFTAQDSPIPTVVSTQAGTTRIFNIGPGAGNQPTFSRMTLDNGFSNTNGGAIEVQQLAQPTFSEIIIQNSSSLRGGAIYVGPNAFVTIEKSSFLTNTVSRDGGAIYVENGTLIVRQSDFRANEAAGSAISNHGGAIYAPTGLLNMENILFAENHADDDGGALYLGNAPTDITHATFVSNTAGTNGGGIYNSIGTVSVINSVLAYNTAVSGGAIYNNTGNVTLSYSNLWQNSVPPIAGTVTQNNNLANDPLFLDTDFRLSPGSPAIDTGTAVNIDVDFEDDFRPSDQGYDMGYDELAGCIAKRGSQTFGSIQDAIYATETLTNTILVSGICRGVHPLDIGGSTIQQTVHITDDLIIQGGWRPDFEARDRNFPTIIDPEGAGRGFYVTDGVSTTLSYLTILNGDATGLGGGPSGQDAGGSVYNNNGTLHLYGVTILTSTATYGGALYNHTGDLITSFSEPIEPAGVVNSTPSLQQPLLTILQNNTAVLGGAVYLNSGTVSLDSMRVVTNTASSNGGGIYNGNSTLTASNLILSGNEAVNGAGVYNNATAATRLYHLTIYTNTATTNGGGVYVAPGTNTTLRSNIFQSNQASSGPALYVAGGTPNEDYNYYHDHANPAVVGITIGGNSVNSTTPPGLLDPANGDFHLENDAPAGDAGDPLSPILHDFDDNPRPSNQAADMGADEIVGCLAELNDVVYGSIQVALAHAQPGDTINVSGRCSGVHNFDTGDSDGGPCTGTDGLIQTGVHITASINLVGGWDENFTNNTDLSNISTIDAKGMGRAIYIAPGITSTVEGFHIVNGFLSGTNANGAGICIDNAEPVIQNNTLISNTAGNGGAIYSLDSSAEINGNRIHTNNATHGAGVYVNGGDTAVWNNFIYQNQASGNGGAIANQGATTRIWHNTLVENNAGTGGGVYIVSSNPDIRSNILMSNIASTTDGIHGAAGSAPSVDYNNYYSQTTNVGGTVGSLGANSLQLNPLFTTAAYTITFDSPMLDAGDPNLDLLYDFEEDLRPSHQSFDIGADEIGGCYVIRPAQPDEILGSLPLAVALADPGETILVDGICRNAQTQQTGGGDNVTQNLFLDKSLTIDGDWNSGLLPTSYLTATLDALQNGRVLFVDSGTTVTLTNITLANGQGSSAGINDNGGGVFNQGELIITNSAITTSQALNGGGGYNIGTLDLSNSYIGHNNALQGGGAFYNDGGQAYVHGNYIHDNSATNNSGGAIYQNNGLLDLNANRIFNNNAFASNGGGVFLTGGTGNVVDVRNNFIYRNTAVLGGGIYNSNTDAAIWHNTLYRNTATNALQSGAGIYSANNTPIIRSNILDLNIGSGLHAPAGTDNDYNNAIDNLAIGEPADYSGGVTAGANSISLSPNYVGFEDFHLNESSPGVDVADSNVPFDDDIDGDIRPTNGGPDIGADEVNLCLVRVIDPTDPNPTTRNHIFGVLQEAIDFAESFALTDELPRVEIARGECSGVLQDSETGTWQVGIVRENLYFEGSLRRFDFADLNDYTSIDVGTVSSVFNAEGEGRVITIMPGANPTFEHLAFVNGNASANGGDGQGGGLYNPGAGYPELWETFLCANTAVNGGGYYGASNSNSYFNATLIGFCPIARVTEEPNGAIDFVYKTFYDANSASNNGGGFYSTGNFDVRNAGFIGNSAGNQGGGIYSNNVNNRLVNVTFYNNTAQTDGGGIYNLGNDFALYHNSLRENYALTGAGGGLYNGGDRLILNSTIVYSNTAVTGFGGLHSTTSLLANTHNNFYNNSPSDSNQGVGDNHVSGDPIFLGFSRISRYSPVIDQADQTLLANGIPGNSPIVPITEFDFDSELEIRPDGNPNHNGLHGIGSDIGADEYYKDFGCDISPQYNETQATQGQTLIYTFNVLNSGNPYPALQRPWHGYTDTISITLQTDTLDWDIEMEVEGLGSGGNEYVKVMDWQESIAVTVTVQVPLVALESARSTTILRCTSMSMPENRNDSQSIRVNVGLSPGVLVEPNYNVGLMAGEVITFEHTVTNIGNAEGDFRINADSGEQYAFATLVDDQGNTFTETVVTLDPGQQITTLLRTTILDSAMTGGIAETSVIATDIETENSPTPIFGSALNTINILPSPGTRYVAPGSLANNNTNCTDPNNPCATIQFAVDQAVDGDAILVSQGLFNEVVTHTVGADTYNQTVYVNKSLTIQGGYSVADDWAYAPMTYTTRVDGNSSQRVFYVEPGITVTLSSLVVQNGRSASQPDGEYGAGIFNAGANLTITGTWVLTNSAKYGSGLYHAIGDLSINSTVFADNRNPNGLPSDTAGEGGAIYLEDGDAIIENNTFAANQANGIFIDSLADTGTPDGRGGAIYGHSGSLWLLNNIFSYNNGNEATAVYISGTTVITSNNNLFYYPGAGDPFVAGNITEGPDSLYDVDPLFTDGRYHIDILSPAKDSGSENTAANWQVDFDAEPRISGSSIDIGADERLQRPLLVFTPISQTATIAEGELHVYEFTLTNLGDPTEDVTITMANQSLPPGGSWAYGLTPTSYTGLATYDAITVTFTITGAERGYTDLTIIQAQGSSGTTGSATARTTVNHTPGVEIAQSENGSSDTGQTITYTHTLTNTGDGPDEYTLQVVPGSDQPSGWNITITPTQTGFVLPQQTMTFTVAIDVPVGLPVGAQHTVEIEALAVDPDARDVLTDTTTINATADLRWSPTAITQTVPDNSTAVFLHTLQNFGNITDTVTLTASNNQPWAVAVTPTPVTLTPGAAISVAITVTVPANTGGLVNTTLITATSQLPVETATAVDTTIVQGTNGVLLEPDYDRTGLAGSDVVYAHTLTNLGNITDNFTITANGNPGWLTAYSPTNITLGAGLTTTVYVTVTIPPGSTPAMLDTTTITATSDTDTNLSDTAVDITRVQQEHSLSFTADETQTTDAGININYQHTLQNTGNYTDTFQITAVSGSSWAASVAPPTITLAAGQSTIINVELAVPAGATGRTDIMNVTASSVVSPTATGSVVDTTRVNGTISNPNIIIAPNNTSSGAPGQTITYQHTITNTGDTLEDFSLTAVSNQGWVVTVNPLNIRLAINETAPVTVTLTVPITAPNGVTDITTVTAASDTDNTINDTATDTTTVIRSSGVLLEPDNTQTVNPLDVVVYTHTLTNLGSATDTYTLAATGNWTTGLSSSPITLAGGASATIFVTVTVPPGASGLTDIAEIVATSNINSTATDSATNTTIVNGNPAQLGVAIAPDRTGTGMAGTTVQYQHTFTNTGAVADDYLLSATSSSGWNVSTNPGGSTFVRLQPGASSTMIVQITIPANAPAGSTDNTLVTVRSRSNPNITDTALDATTVEVGVWEIYMPAIFKPSSSTIPPTPTPTVRPPPPPPPTITPTPCAPTGVDLTVSAIELIPANPTAGQAATVRVTIRNQGTVDVAFGNNFYLDFYVNRTPAPYLPGDLVWGVQGVSLQVGASVTYEGAYTFTGGSHQLWAQVDTDNTVNECPREDNNRLNVSLTVSGLTEDGQTQLEIPASGGPRVTPTPESLETPAPPNTIEAPALPVEPDPGVEVGTPLPIGTPTPAFTLPQPPGNGDE